MLAILPEDRSVPRHLANDRVMIRQGANCLSGQLRDISAEGCCVILPGALASNAPIFVAVEGIEPVEARVIWARNGHYGLRFLSPSASTLELVPPSPFVSDWDKHNGGRQPMAQYGSGAGDGPARLGGIAAALLMAGSCAIASTFEGLIGRLRSFRR